MKPSVDLFGVVLGLLVLLAAASSLAQSTAPVLTAEQKLSILTAQHKKDLVTKQQSDLALQIANLQKNITDESARLIKLQQDADATYNKAVAAVTTGVDEKKWKWDGENLGFTAVPAPAAPANASDQPAKPASSPGAAAPPTKK
jgi:hypothetical protein